MISYVEDSFRYSNSLEEAIKIAESFEFEQISVLSKDIQIVGNEVQIQGNPFKISKTGIINLCDALKIPDPFAERIPTDLFVTNVNRLAQEKKDTIINLYFDKNEVLIDSNYRTFFQPISNKSILENISTFEKQYDFERSRFMFQNHFLKIEIAGQGLEVKSKGDIHSLGSAISHYPTSKSTTIGNLLIWTYACTNGAILPNEYGRDKLLNKAGRNINEITGNFLRKLVKFVLPKESLQKLIDSLHVSKFEAKELVRLYKRIQRLTEEATAFECMGKGFTSGVLDLAEKLVDDGNDFDEVDVIKYNPYYAITDFGSNKVTDTFLSRKFQKIGGQLLVNALLEE